VYLKTPTLFPRETNVLSVLKVFKGNQGNNAKEEERERERERSERISNGHARVEIVVIETLIKTRVCVFLIKVGVIFV